MVFALIFINLGNTIASIRIGGTQIFEPLFKMAQHHMLNRERRGSDARLTDKTCNNAERKSAHAAEAVADAATNSDLIQIITEYFSMPLLMLLKFF